MILIKEKGFTTLECVISLFIISMIVFVMTKNSNLNEGYSKENTINNFTVRTLATPTSHYKCYNLNVKVLEKENKSEIELDTYVFKKK